MKKLLLTLSAFALACAAQAQTTTLFDQSFTEEAGNQPSIDGTAVGSANTGAGVAATWTAGAAGAGALRTDGHVFTLASDSAYVDLGTIVNDAKGTATGVFTLTTVMNQPGGSNWVSSGFFQSANITDSFVDAGGLGTAIYRIGGNLDFFSGIGTSNAVGSDPAVSGAQTLITVLDVSTWDGVSDFGSVSFYVDSVDPGNLQGSYSFVSGDLVDYTSIAAGISTQAGGGEGVIQSISLTQSEAGTGGGGNNLGWPKITVSGGEAILTFEIETTPDLSTSFTEVTDVTVSEPTPGVTEIRFPTTETELFIRIKDQD